MASLSAGLEFDPFPALEAEALNRFFALDELANRTIEGGWELLFRNLLIRELGDGKCFSLKGLELDRETTVVPMQGDGKRKEDKAKICDIAVLKVDGEIPIHERPLAIFEIKHNFATQPEVFAELKSAMDKWSSWRDGKGCEFHYIQIVTDIRRLIGRECEGCCINPDGGGRGDPASRSDFCHAVCSEVFKYRIQPSDGKREKRMDEICEHLDFLQSCVDPELHSSLIKSHEDGRSNLGIRFKKFSVASGKYFLRNLRYAADVYVFVVSQKVGASQVADGTFLERKGLLKRESQAPLLDFSKRGDARNIPDHCMEPQ